MKTKIQLKLPPELLFLLYQIVLSEIHQVTGRKADKSLKQELFEEIYRRCKGYTKNPNGKPRSLSLWYHLAECLLGIIAQNLSHPQLGYFERNQLEMFKNELHQKLL